MSWFSESRFGKFFSSGRNFLQQSFTSLIGRQSTVWIDLKNSRNVYDTIPQLQIVTNRKASMAANGRWSVVNEDGEEQFDQAATDALNLVRNPNPMQSGKKWFKQNRKQFYIYRNSFVLKNQPISIALPVTLNNLPAGSMKAILSGRFFDQIRIEDIILRFELQTGESKPRRFETKDVMLVADCDLDDPILGTPIVEALKYPLSNIDGAYKSRNILINQRGAFGIISTNAKEGQGGVPFGSTEQDRINKQYSSASSGQFGNQLGQSPWMLTKASVSFDPMTVPVDELKLFEEVDSGLIDIIDMMGLNVHIFPRKEGTTFENAKAGLRMAYQDTIIPEGEEFADALSRFVGLTDQGRRYKLSYDHLAVLQENKKEKSEVLLNVSRSVNQLSSADIEITEEQRNAISEGLGTAFD